MKKYLNFCILANASIIIILTIYALLIPAGMIIYDLSDPGLYSNSMPRCVFRWHKALSPKYEKWARRRFLSGAATEVTTKNISGTEWPVFGSVFYLWATESLQEAFEEDPEYTSSAPKYYAKGAIEAAAALVADPNHANWVKEHWGEDYLEKENLFYRMLLIGGLTSYQKLSGDTKYEELLRSQAESLAKELDESPYGLLDDYPGQCYPVDIVPAIAVIQRSDMILGTDHSEFVARAVRGFQNTRLDEDTGLPGYLVSSITGKALDSARGVGLSFMLIWAPELWPQTAQDWYEKYEDQFWQQDRWLAGFREFPKGVDLGKLIFADVDAGPIIRGYGAAACAFGIGASRSMGRFDHSYPLAAEAIVGLWPLPNGTLVVPRMLSNISDAPYLGEAAMLFTFTRKSIEPEIVIEHGKLPWIVYVGIMFLIFLGTYEIVATSYKMRKWYKKRGKYYVPVPKIQILMWFLIIIAALITWKMISVPLGLIFLLVAQIVPLKFRKKHIVTDVETKLTNKGEIIGSQDK